MIKKTIMFLLTIIFIGTGYAQNESKTVTHKYFKISPFALFEPETSLQFSYEYPVKQDIGIEHELGFISSELFQNVMLQRSFIGVKTKHELRIYKAQRKGNSFFYHGPQVMYKFVKNNKSEEIWMNQFWQELDYEVKRHVLAAHYKMGIVQHSKNLPLIWDWSLGLGYRYHIIDKSDVPSEVGSSVLWYEDLFGIEINQYGIISPTVSVKVGFLPKSER